MSKQASTTVVSARIPNAVADKLKMTLSTKNISLSSALSVIADDSLDIVGGLDDLPPPNIEKGLAMIGIAAVGGATSYGVYKGSKHLIEKLDTDLSDEHKKNISIGITIFIMLLLSFAAFEWLRKKK